ncbi:MAG: hypothetical protein GC160_26470 [Acidobacteria bacterium]|nr:hypothetical protein [Acidobacteriota bacterium]
MDGRPRLTGPRRPLTPEQQGLLDEQVRTVRYSDAAAVLEAALQALQEQQHKEEQARAEIREKIRVGYEQAARGELLDGPSVIEELRGRLEQRRELR